MALQLPYEDGRIGAIYPNAYHRINNVRADYLRKRIEFEVLVYRDMQAAKNEQREPITLRYFAITNDDEKKDFDTYGADSIFQQGNTDPRKLCYLWLKTHALYAGALDV